MRAANSTFATALSNKPKSELVGKPAAGDETGCNVANRLLMSRGKCGGEKTHGEEG